jgi:predicted TPR repeat methyltransferase
MKQSNSIYDSARLSAGYAFNRPPVHKNIIETERQRLNIDRRLGRALDVGCGAGLSTAALDSLAEFVVGMEPSLAMLRHSGEVAPRAAFVAGEAERLPFAPGSFDLIAAAG